jgi:biotin carboxylase
MTEKKQAIWLFSGGPMQEHAAKKIIELGYQLIITDINRHCACAKYAHDFVECDTFDFSANIDAADRLKMKYEISAGITLAADCHETVALVNRHLGLTGIDPKIAHICRHKNLTRQALTSAGIPQPKYACVDNLDDARSFLTSIGNQGVIKSTDNSGSRGFSKINSPEELTESVFEMAILSGTTGSVLIEEALIPVRDDIAELSVETLWFNGKMYWLNWVDRLFRSDLNYFPSFQDKDIPSVIWGVEVGHINPAQHAISIINKINKMIFDAGVAIGMNDEVGGHILKADIMLTNEGPVIIEITPRLSGGWDSSATTLARGADFQSGVILLALGEDLDLELWHKYFEFKSTNLYASIWADIPSGAIDNIGRKFSLGTDFEREKSLQLAFNNSKENNYVI